MLLSRHSTSSQCPPAPQIHISKAQDGENKRGCLERAGNEHDGFSDLLYTVWDKAARTTSLSLESLSCKMFVFSFKYYPVQKKK